jgi:hypothetical protein
VPDRGEAADAPAACHGCGADLSDPAVGTTDADLSWAQIWDTPPVVLEKAHWWLPRLRCGSGKKITTAAALAGGAYARARILRQAGLPKIISTRSQESGC